MTNAENIKLAIQAAWLVNEPAFALTLALREHGLRGLCLQCAGQYRRLTLGRDGQASIWLICRQCYQKEVGSPSTDVRSFPHVGAKRLAATLTRIQLIERAERAAQRLLLAKRAESIPTLIASIYTPPPHIANSTFNSLWLDTTELRVHVRRKARWEPVPNSDELFEQLGVEPEQIHQVMSSYAATIDATLEAG